VIVVIIVVVVVIVIIVPVIIAVVPIVVIAIVPSIVIPIAAVRKPLAGFRQEGGHVRRVVLIIAVPPGGIQHQEGDKPLGQVVGLGQPAQLLYGKLLAEALFFRVVSAPQEKGEDLLCLEG